ncbi:dynein regulatory complex subunit 6 isoform X2 [Clupea harengus]|uniref:Dynein regulatory complex subunit 6 isoform X2 n=1 Tax=Clupea harengus TaxID=7950 RepID=A0A6P8FBE6_CLUHA|nr:dynein regulatory complex subunit 6 isoform X2 [Clupea harengus]
MSSGKGTTFCKKKHNESDAYADDDVEVDVYPSDENVVLDIMNIFIDPDDSDTMSPFFEEACYCYHKSLFKMCFMAWKRYILKRKTERIILRQNMDAAQGHYSKKVLHYTFRIWIKWVQCKKKRKKDAVKKIQKVYEILHIRNIFFAWRYAVQDSKRSKEYFEKWEIGFRSHAIRHEKPSQQIDTTEKKDIISMLPSKLSMKIFQYLESGDLLRCAEVCDTWMAITQTCSLWDKINFSGENHWIQSHDVEKILQAYRPFVVHLNLRGCVSLQWPTFRCISECRNLQELNLSECTNINDETVRIIAESCQSLLYLNLSYTYVTNRTLKILARCCMNLQYLSLAHCRKFTDKGLQFLATERGCHGLVHIDLSGCTQITVDGFGHIAAGCSLLQHIVFDNMPTFTDKCLQVLTAKCHSLVTISVLESPHLTDTAFKTIAEVASLKKLRIQGNNHITDIGWKAVCKSSPKLSHLHAADCSKMTDACLKCIALLKNLTHLDISDSVRVSDVGLRYLTDGPSACKIREFDLSNCHVNDGVVLKIVQRCSVLRTLNLAYCESLTDTAIEYFSNANCLLCLDITGCQIQDKGLTAAGGIQYLKKLNISECLCITDMGIEMFCRRAKRLEDFDISHCVALSDLSIKSVSFYCKTVSRLIMAGCPKMTDSAMKYLTGSGPCLKELDVSGCVLLTDRASRILLKGRQHFHSLTMLYCRGISKQAALRLQPGLKHWEHSRDDAPYWYGYDNLQLKKRPEKQGTPLEYDDSGRNSSSLPT